MGEVSLAWDHCVFGDGTNVNHFMPWKTAHKTTATKNHHWLGSLLECGIVVRIVSLGAGYVRFVVVFVFTINLLM